MEDLPMKNGEEKILLVDDEPNALIVYSELLREWGYDVVCAGGTLEAMEILRSDGGIVLAVVDLKMPAPDGMALFRWIKDHHPDVPVIILTAYGTIPSAVEAISEGIFHYLTKPPEPEQLQMVIKKAVTYVRMTREIKALRRKLEEASGSPEEMVGQSPAFSRALEMAGIVAVSEAPVLILGQTGTGKEMIARFIHRNSRRSAGPFVSINCGALPPSLLESELFGHEKGAFTGAVASRKGRFEEADGGTIFLDEVGDCSPDLQVKLLRVLEERTFHRLGSGRSIRSDFRLVAATNRDLVTGVRDGSFREDLYFRINVFEITIPPLKERMEDLPVLAWHFLKKSALREGRSVEGIEPSALEVLMSYRWPGNIRELENVIHRGIILADGPLLRDDHLPKHLRDSRYPADWSEGASPWPVIGSQTLSGWEKIIIRATLARNGGNKSKTARILGISRKVLYSKIRHHQIGPV
jgi:DNA-binding NtrC family response regulator